MIKKLLKQTTSLYDTYKVLDDNDKLRYDIEIRLEQVLSELAELIADSDESQREKADEYVTHLHFYGIYTYQNGKENTSIVDEIIEDAKKQLK